MAWYGVRLNDGSEQTVEAASWPQAGAIAAGNRSRETGRTVRVVDLWPLGEAHDIVVVHHSSRRQPAQPEGESR